MPTIAQANIPIIVFPNIFVSPFGNDETVPMYSSIPVQSRIATGCLPCVVCGVGVRNLSKVLLEISQLASLAATGSLRGSASSVVSPGESNFDPNSIPLFDSPGGAPPPVPPIPPTPPVPPVHDLPVDCCMYITDFGVLPYPEADLPEAVDLYINEIFSRELILNVVEYRSTDMLAQLSYLLSEGWQLYISNTLVPAPGGNTTSFPCLISSVYDSVGNLYEIKDQFPASVTFHKSGRPSFGPFERQSLCSWAYTYEISPGLNDIAVLYYYESDNHWYMNSGVTSLVSKTDPQNGPLGDYSDGWSATT